jgi:uncharacterized iron-regulated membrane protein
MAIAATSTKVARRFWPWLRTAHAWVGLAACLFLFIFGTTGALLAIEPVLLRATVPGAAGPVVTDAATLAASVTAAEREFGADRVVAVIFASEHFALHQVSFRGGGGAWLDPQTNAIVEQWSGKRVGEWLFALHHELLLDDTGKTIAGWIAVLALLLLVSGLAYWAKLGLRGWRAWPRASTTRELDAAHRTWGAVAAVPLLVILATGAGLALPGVAKPLLAALTGERAAEPPPPRMAEDASPAARVDWPRALTNAQARYPDATLRLVVHPKGAMPPYTRLQQPAEWHANGRTFVWFAPGTGDVLGTRDALTAPRFARAHDLLWPLHAQRVGGPLWPIVAGAAGVALAVLSVLGALAFLRRRRRAD